MARGTPATPPVHGRIAWARDFFRKGFALDERTGRIDYREAAGDPIVAEGQLLARIVPPVEGTPGVNVLGEALPADKARHATLRPGQNVRADDKGVFHACVQGRVRWTGDVLAVDDVLAVPGSVGLESGNLRHPGAVTVQGDIEEGAELVAGGDVEVHGMIAGATVRCGGSLTVHGGIAGAQGCVIVAQGSVHAKFILKAEVSAGGDIAVEREIDQSVVRSGGLVLAPHGRIAGGVVSAMRGVVAAQIGTEGATPTELHVGEEDPRVVEMRELRQAIGEHEQAAVRIHVATERAHRREKLLTPPQREALAALDAQESGLAGHLAAERARLAFLQEQPRGAVLVSQWLHADVSLNLAEAHLRVPRSAEGPLRAAPKPDGIHLVRVPDFARALAELQHGAEAAAADA